MDSMRTLKTTNKVFRFSDEICKKKVQTVTIPNETEENSEDNIHIPRKREQRGGRGNGNRGRRNEWDYYGNRSRQGYPNWYAPNQRYASRNPNVNMNDDRNWNEFRRYPKYCNYSERDNYYVSMNNNRRYMSE
jgi:hypothetical protein